MRLFVAFLLCLPFCFWNCGRIVKNIQFDQNIGGYLKRAADANTVDLARTELSKAVESARSQGMTDGYTSVLYRTPGEDVGFWYQNLSASLQELSALPAEASPLERSNMLMKLRETLLDEGEATHITVPSGISVFPANSFWAFAGALCGVFFLVGIGFFIAAVEDL